jgi:hypothetical protein
MLKIRRSLLRAVDYCHLLPDRVGNLAQSITEEFEPRNQHTVKAEPQFPWRYPDLKGYVEPIVLPSFPLPVLLAGIGHQLKHTLQAVGVPTRYCL